MYGWIVNGLSSLFDPITGSQNPTERLGKASGETDTRGGLTAGIQQQENNVRPTKRNYQSVYVAEGACQNEPVEVKRRRRDVVATFVKKTVAGVAGLLGLRNALTSNCGKHRRYEETKIPPVTLGIDELHTSCMNTYEWRMDKATCRLKERDRGNKNAFQRPSPPLMRKFSGAGLPPGGQERGRDGERRSSLQLLPSRPALGVGMGTAAASPDGSCPGPGHSRCSKQCLTVEEAIKRTDKEQYRRLVLEMVSEKYSNKQPLSFHQTKPQDVSLPQGEHITATFGRARDSAPRRTGPVLATPRAFTWRNPSAPTEARDRRPDTGLYRPTRALEDTPQVRGATQKPTADVDLSKEVATRLNLVDRENTALAQPDKLPVHTAHLRLSDDDFPKLTKDMAAEVSRALAQSDPNRVLSAAFKLRITQRDLATLQEGGWLNDEVINFYLSLVMEQSARGTGGPRVYSFSTFFFSKLRGGGVGGQAGGHGAVKRWTKAVDLFLYDLLLVPLHLGVHWALAVIDFKSRTVMSYDSIGHRHEDICNLLLFYLREEHKAKKARDLDIAKWTISSLRASEIPQQKNGSDCGVFACKYANFVAKGRPLTFRQCHMPLFRKLMIWEILNQKLL